MSKADSEWQTYRSRFLIRAKQLSQSLMFVDALGREHRGKKGDYLVESANGAQRIWPRQLFEDTHALLYPAGSAVPTSRVDFPSGDSLAPQLARKGVRGATGEVLSGKSPVRPSTPAVNCLRYNI